MRDGLPGVVLLVVSFPTTFVKSGPDFVITNLPVKQVMVIKAYYQAFFWVLIDLIVELLGLIIKSFDNQTES
jgi:hypothetical protein